MALIKCSECGKEVSSNAANCPNCGNPIAAGFVPGNNTPHVTTEKTKKSLKATGCVFVTMLLIGVFLLMVYAANKSKPVGIFGGIMTFVGFIGYVINRVQIWWQHG